MVTHGSYCQRQLARTRLSTAADGYGNLTYKPAAGGTLNLGTVTFNSGFTYLYSVLTSGTQQVTINSIGAAA